MVRGCSPHNFVAIRHGPLQKMGATKKNIQNGRALCIDQVFASRKVYLAPMFDFIFFLNMNFACMLGPWCKHAAKVQRLRSQNWQPCHLSLSALLSNTTHLLGKTSKDMNASLFFSIAKIRPNISVNPFPYKKGWVAPSWPLRKNRDMVEKQVLTKWCLCWGTRSKHASKIHTQEKDKIEHPGKASGLSIPPYKMEWWWKEVVDAHDPSTM